TIHNIRSYLPTPLWRCLSSTPNAGGFTAAAASADRAIGAGRVPRMPRWLRQPRHGSRAWYSPCTLASGSDPRHESRVALYLSRRTPGTARGFELALSTTWTETISLLVVLSANVNARPQSSRLTFWFASPVKGTRMLGQFKV